MNILKYVLKWIRVKTCTRVCIVGDGWNEYVVYAYPKRVLTPRELGYFRDMAIDFYDKAEMRMKPEIHDALRPHGLFITKKG